MKRDEGERRGEEKRVGEGREEERCTERHQRGGKKRRIGTQDWRDVGERKEDRNRKKEGKGVMMRCEGDGTEGRK